MLNAANQINNGLYITHCIRYNIIPLFICFACKSIHQSQHLNHHTIYTSPLKILEVPPGTSRPGQAGPSANCDGVYVYRNGNMKIISFKPQSQCRFSTINKYEHKFLFVKKHRIHCIIKGIGNVNENFASMSLNLRSSRSSILSQGNLSHYRE